MYNDVYHLDMTEDEIKIASTTSEASMSAFLLLYFSRALDMGNQEAVRRFCKIPFVHMGLMKMDEASVDEVIEKSISLFYELDVKILPYFDVQ